MDRISTATGVRRLAGLTLGMAALSGIACLLLAVRIEHLGHLAFGYLAKNLILAWIPFVLALALAATLRFRGPRLLVWLLATAWLLFLPNAPYIVTDFIHLGRTGGAPLWFDIALFGSFALSGLTLGSTSLFIIHGAVQQRAGGVLGWMTAIAALLLSALGVYLGRFLRFNSWDVLQAPYALVAVTAHRLAHPLGNPFLLQFAVGSSVILLGVYLLTWTLGRRVGATARC